jgi:uncharacterized protein YdcH (DUF465 family)
VVHEGVNEGMSYSICRIAKIKKSGVTGIQIHDQREKEGISNTNPDIDWNKTKENIELLEQQERFRTVVSKRIVDLNLKKQPRCDATVMAQCLVTSDNGFFEKMSRQEQLEFFKKSYDFIKNRYGKENMVSATIHFDERTPHMHVNFVPVTSDGRLCARDLFSPRDLRNLQDDFNKVCRENGYDLQRGKLESTKEHLSVEEYKLNTKYDEFQAKEAELKRLESIDKKADLNAEKGRITYSTKEVEAIKDQNKSLKVEIYNQCNQISQLNDSISKAHKIVSKLREELKGTELPLEQLKDLRNENRAFKDYLKTRPSLEKEIEQFERVREQAYKLGEAMVKLKEYYLALKNERNVSIEKTYSINNQVKECDNAISDLGKRQCDINDHWSNYESLEKELGEHRGIFRVKYRKEIQEKMSAAQERMQDVFDKLKADYRIEPTEIDSKIREYQQRKQDYMANKSEQSQCTDKCEAKMDSTIKQYKYIKALGGTQSEHFRDITNRISARAEFPNDELRNFRITGDDQEEILGMMERENPNCLEKCKDNFKNQDSERQAKIKIHHSVDQWDMER